MSKLVFAPMVDLPLVAVTLALFLWYFDRWAHRSDLETNVDVVARLGSARLRVVVLFVGVLIVCWFFDFAVWSLLAALLAVGLVVALMGFNVDGGLIGFFVVAYLIREWSFGFPEMILHPSIDNLPISPDPMHELVGSIGKTSSSLRPTGDAIIGDATVSVASDDGCLIDAGTDVIVTSYRNGLLRVRPHVDGDAGE